MSYCRWSTDGGWCDIYAYQNTFGFFDIWVAGSRKMGPYQCDPLRVFMDDELTLEEKAASYNANLDDYSALPSIDIDLPNAGAHFVCADLDEFEERLAALQFEGFIVPDYVFDMIAEERDEQSSVLNGRVADILQHVADLEREEEACTHQP